MGSSPTRLISLKAREIRSYGFSGSSLGGHFHALGGQMGDSGVTGRGVNGKRQAAQGVVRDRDSPASLQTCRRGRARSFGNSSADSLSGWKGLWWPLKAFQPFPSVVDPHADPKGELNRPGACRRLSSLSPARPLRRGSFSGHGIEVEGGDSEGNSQLGLPWFTQVSS